MEEIQLRFITNKQTVRILKIVSAFQHTHFLSVKEMSTITSSSIRTTVIDIQKIKEHFSDSIGLESSNSGYSFKVNSKINFENKKKLLVEEEPLFIIIESIFVNNCHSLTEWSEILFTTTSTLDRQLATIQPILDKYELSLSKSPIDLLGNEISIRQFFYDFYYDSEIIPHVVSPSIAFQKIAASIKSENLYSDFIYASFTEFEYIIFISLQRTIVGKTLRPPTDDTVVFLVDYLRENMKNLNFSKSKLLFTKLFKLDINDLEVIYIFTWLITKRSAFSLEAEKQFISRFNLWEDSKPLAISH